MAVTTAAIIGIAAAAASTTMSFDQAGKQKKAQRDAERDADEAMASARKKLEENFYAAQGIKKEPYELEREALLSQGAMAIQAGVESERGAAATAGRVQLAQQQGQAGVRTAMSQDMMALENKQLAEESRLRDIGVQLDLGEVEGAQLAAANAERLRAQAQQQGMQGAINTAGQIASALPLFANQDVDAKGNPISVRPKRFDLPTPPPAPVNPFANSSPFINNPFGTPSYNTQPANINLNYQDFEVPRPLYLQKKQDFEYNPFNPGF